MFYDELNDTDKSTILEKFKEEYGNPKIYNFYVNRVKKNEYYINIDKYNVTFNSLEYLVNLVCELNRPFVVSGPDNTGGHNICFVYGNNANKLL